MVGYAERRILQQPTASLLLIPPTPGLARRSMSAAFASGCHTQIPGLDKAILRSQQLKAAFRKPARSVLSLTLNPLRPRIPRRQDLWLLLKDRQRLR